MINRALSLEQKAGLLTLLEAERVRLVGGESPATLQFVTQGMLRFRQHSLSLVPMSTTLGQGLAFRLGAMRLQSVRLTVG